MADFGISSIHGQSTLKLEQFYVIVHMRLWPFMVFFTLRFRYFSSLCLLCASVSNIINVTINQLVQREREIFDRIFIFYQSES